MDRKLQQYVLFCVGMGSSTAWWLIMSTNLAEKASYGQNTTLVPVSYTHLDVYKRQAIKRALTAYPTTPLPAWTNAIAAWERACRWAKSRTA